MGHLDGKIALVTGASRGIGKAIALAYARAGARLVISARTPPDLERAAQEIASAGAEVKWLTADLTNAGDAQSLVRFAVSCYGGLHVLVNNASLLGSASADCRISFVGVGGCAAV